MSIVHTPLFTSRLIIVPSRMFRLCGFSSSSNAKFPARGRLSAWDERFDNARTPEGYASVNPLICLVWNWLLTRVSDVFTICCGEFIWCVWRSTCTRGNIPSGITSCSSRARCGSDFRPSVLHLDDVLGSRVFDRLTHSAVWHARIFFNVCLSLLLNTSWHSSCSLSFNQHYSGQNCHIT